MALSWRGDEVKLALIRPNLGDFRSSDAMPPLALGILAARSPGCQIVFYDEKVEAVPTSLDCDLVAMSVETYTARRAYALAEGYRKQGLRVVMGGYHPTFLPQEVLEHADAVVIGDAEGAWERLLEDARGGRLEQTYLGDNNAPLTDYRIDRSIYADKKYNPVELAQFGRGCRFACDFCSIHAFYGKSLRSRSLDGLREELETLDRRKLLFFVDDNLFGKRDELVLLLKMLKPLKMRWSCQISIDVAKDDELLDLMADCGCTFVLIGFESLNPQNLKQMGKGWNSVSGDYLAVVKKLHSRGIGIYGTFVFGYDQDTEESIAQSVEFAIRARLDIANFNPLTPTPGSRLYRRLEKEGRLLAPTWWRDPDWRYGDPIYEPRGMSAQTLAIKVFEAKKQFYSWSSIGLRMLNHGAGLSVFRSTTATLANVVSRREIYRKNRRSLGV
jgi:radical SAM superfamily enzyme YgiQ (UPF0313 family)